MGLERSGTMYISCALMSLLALGGYAALLPVPRRHCCSEGIEPTPGWL